MIWVSCAWAALPNQRPALNAKARIPLVALIARRKRDARVGTNEQDIELPPKPLGGTSRPTAPTRAIRGVAAHSSPIELSAFLRVTIRLLLGRVNGISRKPSASTPSRRR